MNKHTIFDSIGAPVEVLPLAARSASGNGSAIDLRAYEGDVVLTMQALPTGGDANETLDVAVQDSADGSTDWQPLSPAVAFTQVVQPGLVAVTLKVVVKKDEVRRYIRAASTLAGTTPTFTYGVSLYGLPKYPA